MKEEWLLNGAVVPVDVETTSVLVAEIKRLIGVVGGMALAQPEQEPVEYWNAVEGWVKIDEVREHFDSVGCGTIYKAAGEDRVPVYTTPEPRNFCPRCGKRTPDLTTIHTCTPPRGLEMT